MTKRHPAPRNKGFLSFLSNFFTKTESDNVLITRPPRVRLNRLHAVSFDMIMPYKQVSLGISNISSTGIGFLAGHSQWPVAGDSVQGTLNILEYKLPTTLRVVHVTSVIAGCKFTAVGQEFTEILSRYFDAEFDAIQLMKVKQEYIKQTKEGAPVWFKGLDNSELYLLHQDQQIISFTLTFLGNTIQWSNSLKSPQYGVLSSSEDALFQISGMAGSPDSIHDPEELNETAIKFIHNIRDLKQGFKEQIERILHQTDSPTNN